MHPVVNCGAKTPWMRPNTAGQLPVPSKLRWDEEHAHKQAGSHP